MRNALSTTAGALALAMGLALAAPAIAETWTIVTSDANKLTVIDKDSVSRDATVRGYREVIIFHGIQTSPRIGAFRYVEIQASLHCDLKSISILSQAAHADGGAEVYKNTNASPSMNIRPDTIADQERKFVCGEQPWPADSSNKPLADVVHDYVAFTPAAPTP